MVTYNLKPTRSSNPAYKLHIFLFVILFGYNFVLPHSSQAVSATMVILLAIISLFQISSKSLSSINNMITLFLISSFIHVIYIAYGFSDHGNFEFLLINLLTFLVMPFVWILISLWAVSKITTINVVRIIALLTILACGSVAIYFYLFLNFGSYAVSFFVRNSNVLIADGQASAAMFVYATLIFSASAFLAAPHVIRSIPLRVMIIIILVVTALTSGRSALIVSLAIGAFIGIGMMVIAASKGRRAKDSISFSTYFVVLFAVFIAAMGLDSIIDEVNLFDTFENLFSKISAGGGFERTDQYTSLMQGISQTNGLGAGHGVGVNFIRDFSYPWRYELFFLSMVYRVGIIGAAIILIPYLVYVFAFAKRALYGTVEASHVFLFAGFCGSMFAAATNPYPESYIFAWCYILPIIAFFFDYSVSQRRSYMYAS